MKCVTISSTSLDEPYPLTAYMENPSSIRYASYQRRRYIRGDADWVPEVTSSYGYCGKSRLMPS